MNVVKREVSQKYIKLLPVSLWMGGHASACLSVYVEI
jgi:hypothetical protein